MSEMFPSFHEGEEVTDAGSQHGLCTKGGQGSNFISLKNSLRLHASSTNFTRKLFLVTVLRVCLNWSASKSDVAFRWVHSEFNLMLTLNNIKEQK